jgi:hypothetical protein
LSPQSRLRRSHALLKMPEVRRPNMTWDMTPTEYDANKDDPTEND